MAIRNGTPNPLNYFNLRRVEYSPPHFKYFTINKFNPSQIRIINDWIMENLNSRYYIGQGIMLDNTNTIVYNTRIGFESEKEITFFTIACPHIHTR
jgi:hypothetical protein